jgi:two-component system phosphate regulon response regulator PhoB
MGASIHLVHPDPDFRRSARSVLESAGYAVREDLELRFTELGQADVLLVEWQILDPPGESLQWLRSHDSARDARVIVIARRDEIGSAINSLELGADDCLTVPLDRDELLMRVSMSLRRSPARVVRDELRAGPIVMDRARHRVLVNDAALELAPTEFRLMAFFLEHQGRVFSRQELLSRAWSSTVRAGQRTVDVHVRRLRQQLEPLGCEDIIQTVRGFGYRLRVDD